MEQTSTEDARETESDYTVQIPQEPVPTKEKPIKKPRLRMLFVPW